MAAGPETQGAGPVVRDARRWSRDDRAAPAPETEPEEPPRPPGAPDFDDPVPLLRIMTMVRGVLDEIKATTLDEHTRLRVRELHRRVVDEIVGHLGPDLREELEAVRMPLPDDRVPDQTDLRIAEAGLAGWLDGLFRGAQVAMAAQEAAAATQLAELRRDTSTGSGRP